MTTDPIELEVIKSRLEEAALTMENQLFHSGYSPILRESGDGSACILDRNGGAVIGTGAPVHLFPYYRTVTAIIETQSKRLRPGQSYLLNDPYVGGIPHVPDTAVITPFFYKGELSGFCASIAHKPDMGGMVIGSSSANAREIYHEGLLFPGVLYWTEDGPSGDIDALLRANTRSPDETIGDLRAQVGCTRIGCARLTELFDQYGAETMTEALEALIRASANRVRQKLAAIPDGTAEAEARLDHDAVSLDRPVAIRAKVTKTGERIVIDYSGSDPNTAGPINNRPQSAETAGALALLAMLDPDIPINDGVRRVIEFVNPPGRITHASRPRPVNNYFPTLHLTYCVTQAALAQLIPEKAIAPAGLGVGVIALGYAQPQHGKPSVQYELTASSLGGSPAADGTFLVVPTSHISPSQPVEVVESEYPVEITRFEPIVDSAGAGRFRGGPGYRREYRLLDDATMTLRMGHFRFGAWGVAGGAEPRPARCIVNAGTDKEEIVPVIATRPLKAGDAVAIETSGGGGYGSPLERAPARVARDVRDGIVSVAAAESIYGVVLDPADFAVDETATTALRAAASSRVS